MEQQKIDILRYIPFGYGNGITSRELANHTGATPRAVRVLISEARQQTVILNMQDGTGYFRPEEGEEDLVDRWLLQEESRLKQHALALRAARKDRRRRKEDGSKQAHVLDANSG